MKRYLVPAIVVLATVALTSCNNSNQVLLPPPGSSPISRLYVTNDGGSGVLDIFACPCSAATTPSVAFQVPGSTDVDDVAFDSVNTYVGLFGTNKVDAFTTPVTAASTAAFSITTGTGPEGLDVDSSGNLYVASNSGVQIFNAPLSGSSTAATTITAAAIGVKLDAAGNLYVAGGGHLEIFTPPFTNASTPSVSLAITNAWGVFVDKKTGNVWVATRAVTPSVQEFTPPITGTSTPAITITSGVTDPLYPALDASGNLYVSDDVGSIRVYNAPLSNASTPAFSFAAPAPNGIRFGP